MIIHNIIIRNFKSCYGEHKFNFDNLKGLIKLSGPIGAGKTTLSEALIWGLFGTVRGQNNGQLISWNTQSCEIELNLMSKGKEVHIIRNIHKPLIIEVDGKILAGSSKRNIQEILEEEIYDVPKLAIIKMCIISFNQFNSLASMNPGETKQFLDEIFGFKLFSEYNNEVVIEKKDQVNKQIKLQAIYDENNNQIENLKQKQTEQTIHLKESVDLNGIKEQREYLVKQGVDLKTKKANLKKEREQKDKEFDEKILLYQNKMTEVATLGKQAKKHYNTFKSGVCPTCGHQIEQTKIDEYKNKIDEYASIYRENEATKKKLEEEKQSVHDSYHNPMIKCDEEMDLLRKQISKLDAELKSYNDSVQLIQDNFESLIKEYEEGGKYKPAVINRQMYNHPLSLNLYNINNAAAAVHVIKKVIVFESEKSCLKFATYFGQENDISVACCGSNISSFQIQLLLSLGIQELIIALDRQYQQITGDEHKIWAKKMYALHNKIGQFVQISYIFDKNYILEYKASPIDQGKDTFLELYNKRIFI